MIEALLQSLVRVLTDEVMAAIGLVSMIWMVLVMTYLLRWRDWNWLFCLAALMANFLLVVSYVQSHLLKAEVDPSIFMVERRLALIVMWGTIILYTSVRLKEKSRLRRHGK